MILSRAEGPPEERLCTHITSHCLHQEENPSTRPTLLERRCRADLVRLLVGWSLLTCQIRFLLVVGVCQDMISLSISPVAQNVIGNNVGTETFSPVRPGGVVVRVTTEDQHHTRRHNGRVQIPEKNDSTF